MIGSTEKQTERLTTQEKGNRVSEPNFRPRFSSSIKHPVFRRLSMNPWKANNDHKDIILKPHTIDELLSFPEMKDERKINLTATQGMHEESVKTISSRNAILVVVLLFHGFSSSCSVASAALVPWFQQLLFYGFSSWRLCMQEVTESQNDRVSATVIPW